MVVGWLDCRISYTLLRARNVVGFELTVIVALMAIDKPIKQCVECYRVVVVARVAELVQEDKLAQMLW